MKTFSKSNIQEKLSIEGWGFYQKARLTQARRVQGPFRVVTREGQIECQDGYLAIDSGGYPYPIAKDEFERIYKLSV